jgi:hypothetical protein
MSVKLHGPEKYEISNEKAAKLLGYKPQYNIDRMIERALKKKRSAP